MTSVSTPPDRYGAQDTPTKHRWRLISLVVLAVVVLVTVAWLGLHNAKPSVTFENYGYSKATDESVDVTFDVTVEKGTSVVCTLEAMNEAHAQVGSHDVTLPASKEGTTRYTVTLRTTEEPVNGLVDSCRLAD